MKRVRLKLYSYHTFLVIPFIVLFLYGHNLDQTSLSMVWRTLFAGLALSAVLFGVFWLVLRNRLKTGVFVTLLLFGIFQYGVLYEFLEALYYAGKWPFSNIHRYLLAFYFLVLIVVFLVIRYSRHDFIRINYFLNILLFILLIFNVVRIGSHDNGHEIATKPASRNFVPTLLDTNRGRPDVYYIILDGYASNPVLKKFFGYSNKRFSQQLKEIGFQWADSACSNHYYTSLSLNSTLNMKLDSRPATVKAELSSNSVMNTFRTLGYKVYHLNSGYAVTSSFAAADSAIEIAGPNEFEKSMLRHTILRLDDLLGIFARKRLESQFDRMYAMPELRGPKFCFMHFVAPHPPFVFDSAGAMTRRQKFVEHSWEPREAYVNQLIYVNKRIAEFVTRIRKQSPSAVIILQSDHGPWISAESKEEIFEARSGILYTWYSPLPLNIPSNTSSVNTFRYLLRSYFNAQFTPLPDSMSGKTALLADPILSKKVKE